MPSAKKGVSVFNGRSYFPYIWLVFYGVSTGLVKESACGVTTSLVAIINSKHSTSPQAIDLVRAITHQTLKYNFAFTAAHIPGWDNSIADSLSRFQTDWFRTLAHCAFPLHQRWASENRGKYSGQEPRLTQIFELPLLTLKSRFSAGILLVVFTELCQKRQFLHESNKFKI